MHAFTAGSWLERPLISQRAIEPIKWVGLVLMLAEHVWWFVFHQMPVAMMLVGRTTFALFVIALACGVTHLDLVGTRRMIQRLFGFGVLAAIGRMPLGYEWPLNVLFTLGFGVTVFEVLRAQSQWRWVVVPVCLFFGFACEFSVGGVLAVYWACRWADSGKALHWGLPAAIGAICVANGNWFAVGAPLIAVAIDRGGIEVPRVRRLFYWAYVGQWPLLAGLRAVL